MAFQFQNEETWRIIDTQSVRLASCHVPLVAHIGTRTRATRDDTGDLISDLSAACQSRLAAIDSSRPRKYGLSRGAVGHTSGHGWRVRWSPPSRRRSRVVKVSHVPGVPGVPGGGESLFFNVPSSPYLAPEALCSFSFDAHLCESTGFNYD